MRTKKEFISNFKKKERKMRVKIIEAETINSQRDGKIHNVKNLAAAKRIATRGQVFQGTVLQIEDMTGDVLAVKKGGVWSDFDAAPDYDKMAVVVQNP